MFYKKIIKNFEHWGKKAQQLPLRNEEIKQNVVNSLQTTPKRIVERRPNVLRWLIFVTAPALVILFVFNYWQKTTTLSTTQYSGAYEQPTIRETGLGLQSSVNIRDESGAELAKQAMFETDINMPSVNYYGAPDITDTREYSKINANFDIKTRKVETFYTRLKTVVHGYGGRIDNSTVNEKWARISFALPKNSYEAFADEVRGMFPKQFIIIRENSTNLLGQKQNIETQTKNTGVSLATIKGNRENLTKVHNEKVVSLQKEINRLNNLIYSLDQQKKTVSSTDQEALDKLNDEINYYSRARTIKNQSLANENTKYQKNLVEIDNQIVNYETSLDNLNKQDKSLINNIDTVNGVIELRWVSIIDFINLYIPIYKTVIVAGVLIFFGYILFGRRANTIELP